MSWTKVALLIFSAGFALYFVGRYAFELWVYFRHRAKFDKLKARITVDDSGLREVSVADRFLLSYPLAIVVCGGMAYGIWVSGES